MLHLMACSFLLFARAHHSNSRLSLRHGLDANALALLQLCKRIAIWVFHGPDAVVVARRVGLLRMAVGNGGAREGFGGNRCRAQTASLNYDVIRFE